MAVLNSLLILALVALHCVFAHPGHSVAEEALERAHFLKRNPNSVRSCASQLYERGHTAKSLTRRQKFALKAREKRGLPAAKLARRDFAAYNFTHASDRDVVMGDNELDLFSDNSTCILQPEVTQGPYYVDGELIRANVSENQGGVPLFLDIQIINTATCEPVPAVFMDFWHCNATGVYSGVNANGNGNSNDTSNLDATFLRGIQPSDVNGVVQFESIFPGHYSGRATHIHIMTHNTNSTTVRTNSTLLASNGTTHASHVGQLFFDQDLISMVSAVEPYASNTQSVTLNSDDSILGQEADSMDPFVEYLLLGEDVSDGIMAWISIGIDPTADNEISSAATRYKDYGVAHENSMGGGGGGPGGAPGNGSMPSGAMGSGAPPSGLTFAAQVSEPRQISSHSKCRFSPTLSLPEAREDFEKNIVYWDGRFHQDGVGFALSNGLTSDHRVLNSTTGFAIANQSQISNPANEALHIMLLARVMDGNGQAAHFIYPDYPRGAVKYAGAILSAKLNAYLSFNYTFPGYGGLLPSFIGRDKTMSPADGWHGRVSAVDNGQLLWAVYGLCEALRQSNVIEFRQLGDSWRKWLDYTKINAKGIVYRGHNPGEVCETSTLREGTYTYSSLQTYACADACYVKDPYEGELMTWFLYFSGMLNHTQREALWTVKRPYLQAVNYTGPITIPNNGRKIMPITVQKGLYFGSQENLKLLFLPYTDVSLVADVFRNAEKVRTCNSWLTSNPGMLASASKVTNAARTSTNLTDVWTDVIANAGIPSVSFIKDQETGQITSYSVFPTILVEPEIGLAWLKNMLDAKGVQSPYGTVASLLKNGTKASVVVDWQTKAPITLALIGGIQDLVRGAMKRDGIYEEFINITTREYGAVFDEKLNGGRRFMGNDVSFCLPNTRVPSAGVKDFSGCQ